MAYEPRWDNAFPNQNIQALPYPMSYIQLLWQSTKQKVLKYKSKSWSSIIVWMEGREEAADYYHLTINDCIFHLSSDFRFSFVSHNS